MECDTRPGGKRNVIYKSKHIHTHTHTRTHTRAHTYTHTHSHKHNSHTHTHTNTRTHIDTQISRLTHTSTHTHTDRYTHTVGPEVVKLDPPVAARRELNTEKTGSGQTPYLWTLLIHFTNTQDPQRGSWVFVLL